LSKPRPPFWPGPEAMFFAYLGPLTTHRRAISRTAACSKVSTNTGVRSATKDYRRNGRGIEGVALTSRQNESQALLRPTFLAEGNYIAIPSLTGMLGQRPQLQGPLSHSAKELIRRALPSIDTSKEQGRVPGVGADGAPGRTYRPDHALFAAGPDMIIRRTGFGPQRANPSPPRPAAARPGVEDPKCP